MKRVFNYCKIVIIMLVSIMLIGNTVYAESDTDAQVVISGDWQYEISDGEAYIVKFIGDDKDVIIPSEFDGYPVTKILYPGFSESNIESIELSSGIREIGFEAFEKCGKLKTVKLNEGLEIISMYAFDRCNALENINFPSSLKKIQQGAFDCCESLKQVKINEGLELLGQMAFNHCDSLMEIYIPKSVTKVEKGAFSCCSSLKKIEVNQENEVYNSVNDCNAIIEGQSKLVMACSETVIPAGVRFIESLAFMGVEGKDLYIPASVERIFDQAFSYAEFDSITVDADNQFFDSRDDCNAIIQKDDAFLMFAENDENKDVLILGCKNTVIPDTVKAIGDYAFQSSAIKSLEIPSDVKVIGFCAFENSLIEELVIDEGCEEVVMDAFAGCQKLKKIFLPSTLDIDGAVVSLKGYMSLETIEVAAGNPDYDSRDNCNAIIYKDREELSVGGNKSIIPEGIKYISGGAFKNRRGLSKIIFPQSLYGISESAFEGCCGLKNVEITEGVRYINDFAFKNCVGIEKIVILGSSEIRSGAFEGCANLEEIWIPAEVESIQDKIEDLNNIYYDDTFPPFAGCAKLTIVTPKDSYAQQYAVEHNIPYRNEDIWSAGDVIDKKTDNTSNNDDNKEIKDETEKTDASDNKKEDASVGQTQQQEQTSITEQQDTNTSIVELSTDNVTTFNIKNKKTYKKSKKVIVKDKDGIKSIKINGKTIKVKSRKKSISFKLSKYKKYFKKKDKWNKLVVTDVNGNKKTIQFKVK